MQQNPEKKKIGINEIIIWTILLAEYSFFDIKTKVPKAKANGNQYDDEYRHIIILLFTTA
jgi:hypothetical protein